MGAQTPISFRTTPTGTADGVVGGAPRCVCAEPMRRRTAPWSYRCPRCHTWASTLQPNIGSQSTETRISEDNREHGLAQLRRQNFATILDLVATMQPLIGMRLLDVGSAHGWFLQAATARGAVAVGIEPDAEVAAAATRAVAHDVRVGYFPDVLAEAETFDLISFNDVLEHLPDPRAALVAVSLDPRDGLFQ
jgi:2-polyprenyl-3-methyl-5-hydroxy-6-metoxy-1,4-benzoquinol methylase